MAYAPTPPRFTRYTPKVENDNSEAEKTGEYPIVADLERLSRIPAVVAEYMNTALVAARTSPVRKPHPLALLVGVIADFMDLPYAPFAAAIEQAFRDVIEADGTWEWLPGETAFVISFVACGYEPFG